MLIIGLTGTTGSGKGYVSALLGEYGFYTVDTDAVTHELYGGGECARAVADAFGDVLDEGGAIDRVKLGSIVFADKEKLLLLQSIVYKYILGRTDEIISERLALGDRAVVVDAPMLFESGFDKKCDIVIAVTADREIRLDRIMKRDNISREKALARMNSQMSDGLYESKSDFVIKNGGEDVKAQLDIILRELSLV